MQNIDLQILTGGQARKYLRQISRLSAVLFKEFPYLYDSDFTADSEYLEQYFNSQTSLFVLVFDQEELVACSFSIALQEEIDEVQDPFHAQQISVAKSLYIGAVMINKSYRRHGLFNRIKDVHHNYARDHAYERIIFTTVRRDKKHVKYPKNYRSPECLWHFLGYNKLLQMTVEVEWPRVDTGREEINYLDVWYKDIT